MYINGNFHNIQFSIFILENVKQLQGHQQVKTLKIIVNTLIDLGYNTDYKILNTLKFWFATKAI